MTCCLSDRNRLISYQLVDCLLRHSIFFKLSFPCASSSSGPHVPSHQQCCFKFKQKKIITKLLKINLKLHLVEGAASEPGIVVEVVVHRAHPGVVQGVRHTSGRPAFSKYSDTFLSMTSKLSNSCIFASGRPAFDFMINSQP